MNECSDSPTGEHEFVADYEYDVTGDTSSCEYCGELESKEPVVVARNGKYWQHKGRFQNLYNKLHQELVPFKGNAPTFHGQLLRYASRIYYDIYNNGGCNLRDTFLLRWGLILIENSHLLLPVAKKLKVADFEQKLKTFVRGEGEDKVNDQVVEVVIKFAQEQHRQTKHLVDLVESADWLLDFLAQFPPHDSQGKSLAHDISLGVRELNAAVNQVKKQLGVPKRNQYPVLP